MANNAFVVIGTLKDYSWGKVNGLVNWTKKTDSFQAELWFGDHKSSPSINKKTNKVLESHSQYPLLVKILCANEALSIQVHPDQETAQEGLNEFSQNGNSILADSNGKDEFLIALGEFHAFAGSRNKVIQEKIFADLAQKSKVTQLTQINQASGFVASTRIIFALPKTDIQEIQKVLIEVLIQNKTAEKEQKAFENLLSQYPGDAGVIICLLMQFHVLSQGEAIHVKPGTPHSYVFGLAVEVMTNSDNVLRMGLTKKPINVEAALSIVQDRQVQVLSLPTTDGVHVYMPEAIFEVALVDNATYQAGESEFTCVLNLAGSTTLNTSGSEVNLDKAEAALISGLATKVVVNGHAVVARIV
jgi:mannose-6-phosphate isomerase